MNLVQARIRVKPEIVTLDIDELDIDINDNVIIKTKDAMEFGKVITRGRIVKYPHGLIFKVIRKATEEDIKIIEENSKMEREIFNVVKQKIINYNLPMKLVYVSYTFDRMKLFIYYTSETRVDFRRLVVDLAHIYKTRIQMVQIGPKDEPRICGGIGVCGRRLCCSIFHRGLPSISVEMTRLQNIYQNLPKLSGICGKLKCCIAFENEYYMEMTKRMPKIGTRVTTDIGNATIIDRNILKRTVILQYNNGRKQEIPISAITT